MKTIERLRELEKAATTPRPWKPEEVGEAFRWFRKMGDHNTFTTQDGELAASAVNALPALLAVVEAAQEVRKCGIEWIAIRKRGTIKELVAADCACVTAEANLDAALRTLEGEA